MLTRGKLHIAVFDADFIGENEAGAHAFASKESIGAWVIADCRRCPNEPDGAATLLDTDIPREPDREIEVRLAPV